MASDLKVQHYRTTVSSDGSTLSLTTDVGSIDNAFVIMLSNRHTGTGTAASNHEIDDLSVAAQLTDVGTVTFSRPTTTPGNDIDVSFAVVEYVGSSGGDNEFLIRGRHEVDMASTVNGTATITTTPTNIDNCIPIINGIVSADTANSAHDGAMAAHCSGTNTLNIRGSVSTATAKACFVTVVEFTGSNWGVGHVKSKKTSVPDSSYLTMYVDSEGGTGTTFDVGDWAEAIIIGWGHADVATQDAYNSWPVFKPGNTTTTIEYEFDASHTSSNDTIVAHILKHSDLAITRYTASGNPADGINTVDITSAGITDIAEALPLITTTTNVTTSYPRGWRVIEFDSTTQITHESSYSAGRFEHAIQIADFAAIVSVSTQSVDVGIAEETEVALTIIANAGIASVTTGITTETDVALSLGITTANAITLTIAEETALALPVGITIGNVSADIGLTEEIDIALSASVTIEALLLGLGLATEEDVALAVSPLTGPVSASVGLGEESDVAIAVGISTANQTPIGTAEETNEALAIVATPETVVLNVGQATETDVALAFSTEALILLAIGITEETDTALEITPTPEAISAALDIAEETDQAISIGVDASGMFSIGIVEESDVALPVTIDASFTKNLELSVETDTALPIVASATYTVTTGVATEINEALTLSVIAGITTISIGIAEETDLALSSTVSIQGVSVGLSPSEENEIALPISIVTSYSNSIGIAEEINEALTSTVWLFVDVAITEESDAALGIEGTIALSPVTVPTSVIVYSNTFTVTFDTTKPNVLVSNDRERVSDTPKRFVVTG